jgi:hypothetical protein
MDGEELTHYLTQHLGSVVIPDYVDGELGGIVEWPLDGWPGCGPA